MTDTHTPQEISVTPASIVRKLWIAMILLVLASVFGQVSTYVFGHGSLLGLVRLFNVDRENNIPTFFSAFLFILAALLILSVVKLEKKQKPRLTFFWLTLCLGFFYIAYDELFPIHEGWKAPDLGAFGQGLSNSNPFKWVVPAALIVLVLSILFIKFFLRLPAKTRLTFFLAGFLYLLGSILSEFVGGLYLESHGGANLTYSLITTVEESLEMSGIILFIQGLLGYMAEKHLRLKFTRFE